MVGRVTYGYDGRYFLEGNFGYTGSETFAKGYRFGFFPAMGLAWYISNEHYYPEALKKVVSKLKLRFSIGRTGNDDTGGNRFLYRGTMKQDNSGYNIGFSNSGALGGVGNGITEAQFESPFFPGKSKTNATSVSTWGYSTTALTCKWTTSTTNVRTSYCNVIPFPM